MQIVMHPRLSQPGTLRLWLGVSDVSAPGQPTWSLNGQQSNPVAVYPWQSARKNEWKQANEKVTFVGVFEFRDLVPGASYTVAVSCGGLNTQRSFKLLPDRIAFNDGKSFNVLLVSCFDSSQVQAERLSSTLDGLPFFSKPDLTLLLGDQVYADLPTVHHFPDDSAQLAKKFEMDYRRNWMDNSFHKVLSIAPSVAIPDDHEYWNNYPHAATLNKNTYNPGGRGRWAAAAKRMYEAFQFHQNGSLGSPGIFTIPPLSFFLADTRTLRDESRRFSMHPTSMQLFKQWCTKLIDEKLVGILATGQPLVTPNGSNLAGRFFDYGLPDYEDFEEILKQIDRVAQSGRPMILLTGDVHWGRVTEARSLRDGRPAFAEIICSPSAKVHEILLDEFKTGRNRLLPVGSKELWPKHADPKEPEGQLTQKYKCRPTHYQKGDQICLLSFRSEGSRLAVRATYLPLHSSNSVNKPVPVDISFSF